VFLESTAAQQTKDEIEKYTNNAFAVLDKLDISPEKKEILHRFGESLMKRKV
jgi:geranylgeranyl diphosphate synthase type II